MVATNSWLIKAYQVFKKLLDPLDDIFAIIQAGLMKTKDSFSAGTKALLSFIGKMLIGIVGLVLHSVEFITAASTLYQFIKGKKKNILTAVMASYNFILSGTGVGLSAALIAAALGAPVAALAIAIAPIAIPGLLLCIYVNRLVHKTVSLAKTDRNDTEKHHIKSCEVAFSALEVTGASLIVIGAVTGLFPLMLVGVAIGLCAKVTEIIYQKCNYHPATAIKNFFSSLFQPTALSEKAIAEPKMQSIKTLSLPTKNDKQQITPHVKNENPPRNNIAKEKKPGSIVTTPSTLFSQQAARSVGANIAAISMSHYPLPY